MLSKKALSVCFGVLLAVLAGYFLTSRSVRTATAFQAPRSGTRALENSSRGTAPITEHKPTSSPQQGAAGTTSSSAPLSGDGALPSDRTNVGARSNLAVARNRKSTTLPIASTTADELAVSLAPETRAKLQRIQTFLERRGVFVERLTTAIKVVEEDEAEQQNLRTRSRSGEISASEYVSQLKQIGAQTNAELREALGTQTGGELIEYRNSFPFVPIAQQFAARCASAGAPLSDEAVSSIAIVISKYNVTASPSASPREVETLRAAYDPKAFTHASTILTPSQLEMFKQFWTEHPW